MGFLFNAKLQLNQDEYMREQLLKARNRKTGWKLHIKTKPTGKKQFYYNTESDSTLHYINRANYGIIRDINQNELAKSLLPILANNINVLKYVLENYKEVDYENAFLLPPVNRAAKEFLDTYDRHAYKRNPEYKNSCPVTQSEKSSDPREFLHTTTFGLHTRSKGEAMIAEALYFARVTNFYEKKLYLTGIDPAVYAYAKNPDNPFANPPSFFTRMQVAIYPDFTIPLANGKFIYWEHKGMMGDDTYSGNDYWRTQLYFHNGIYEPVNLISTCDGPDGSVDMQAIQRIIHGIILPQL